MSKNAATMKLLKKRRKDFVEKHAAEYQALDDFDAEQKKKGEELVKNLKENPEFIGDAGTHIVGDPTGAFGFFGIGGAGHGTGGVGRGGFGGGFGGGPHGGPGGR